MISASLNDQHVARLNAKLERFARAMAHPREANRQASVALYGWVIRNFDREGALIGGWAPLHPRTVKEKERIGKERMLVRSGALRASFVPFYRDDNAGVGSELEYSAAHQYGRSEVNLPARPMLPDRRTTLDIGLRVYAAYVRRKVQEANR